MLVYFRKNTKQRIIRLIVLFAIISLVAASLWAVVDIRLRKVAAVYAKSAIKTVLSDSANKAVYLALDALQITYDQLAVISRNSEGIATSVEINTVEANRVKSYITREISKELYSYTDVTFEVPLSAAFGVYYTSFKVPKISYTVCVTTTVLSDFKSNFMGAGINQVLHQILMTVTLESDLAMREDKTEQTFSTDFIVAQTVIVGAVPDAFTSVGHATDEMLEDIFDFGAEVLN